jgi:hypothetical protein
MKVVGNQSLDTARRPSTLRTHAGGEADAASPPPAERHPETRAQVLGRRHGGDTLNLKLPRRLGRSLGG